nr:reverse transcriptase domain-containing protein [Tanacetum cinerariifolium]
MHTRSQSRNNFPQQEASPAIVEPLRIKLPFLEDQFQEDPPVDPPKVSMVDNRTIAELLQAPTEARTWLEKEAPRSILTWDDLVTKFINQFFPPSKTTNLRNEITRFKQRFDESFFEAWDRFNDLLRACPHHEFSKLHQLDTFYNALNVNDLDSLNSAAGGNFLDKMPRECLKIIESKSKVRQSRAKAVVAKVSTSSSTLAISSEVSKLKDMGRALLLDKKNQSSAPASSSTPAPVKAIEPNCVTCSGAHSYQNCLATSGNVYRDNIQKYVSQAAAANYNQENTSFRPQKVANQIRHPGSGTLLSNTITNPKEDLKGITTRSGAAYQGPPIPSPSKVVKQGTEVTKDQVQTPSSQISEPVVTPVSVPIPYPSRRDNERRRDQANEQIEKFYEIFKEMSFEISVMDALILMPKFASTLKALIGNKEKLSEMARTPMNEHCSAVILNKLPRKLGDPGKFLIPREFPGMDECLALANLGASINLMPLFVWEGLSLPELTPTWMTLELVDRSVSKPIGMAKDVSVKVGAFHFPADFVVVDFEPDPRVPLILGWCFLKTDRALIDVHKGELTLRIENEAITYNLDQTVRYSANYNQMTANKIDVICEIYSQEVLGFFTASGNPTPYDDTIVFVTSPTLTLFGDSDFLLFEEADAFLAILNSEPLPPLPNHEQYMPSYKKELKVCEAETVKSSVDEPPEVELKDLPPYLEYAFLEGNNKLPIIIAKELGDEEKSALIKVLKSHKRAIAWKLSDIQGINPEFCTHKILMEEDYKPAAQHQRRVNPKIHDVIKKEVEKLLDARLIYPISDSLWVSPVHCVPKKGGFTIVENEENELIPTRLVTGWRVKENQEKDKNRIKTGQKREVWRSREKFKAVAVDKGRKRKKNGRKRIHGSKKPLRAVLFLVFLPMPNQPPAYQAPACQAPIPQTQSVSITDFESYVKANDAVLRNMQNQGLNLQIQMANLTDMLSKFVSSNTASSSGSGTLPSNTITNPKEELSGITTRSGVAYQGLTIPTPSKVVKQGTELYVSFITLLKNFDREDLESLWSLVQERFSTSKPNNFSDDYLLTTLKAMFGKPDGQDNVWKSQRIDFASRKKIPTFEVYIGSNAKRKKNTKCFNAAGEELSVVKHKLMLLHTAAERRVNTAK